MTSISHNSENGSYVRGPGGRFAVCRWIHVVVLLYLTAASSVQSKLTPRRFDEPSGSGRFDRVTVNRETGDVYVASTSGFVFQLTEDLRLVDVYRGHSSSARNSTVTLLLEFIPPSRTDVKRELTHQKLLLYCETDLCVALDCSGERIRPISRFDGVVDVVPVNASSSLDVLLFVPERQPLVVNISVVALMYSAINTLDDSRQPIDGDTLTALVLEQETPVNSSSSSLNLRYRAEGDGFRSGIRLHSGGRARQKVVGSGGLRYIYEFDDGRFAYFVFVQPTFDGSVETRLARVCIDDDAFQSYAELVVLCRRRPTFQTYFKAAVTAVVAQMGATLSQRLGERVGDETRALYIAMGDRADGYGICVYPLVDVRHEFTQAQRDCYRGSGRILASVDANERRCTEDVSIDTDLSQTFLHSDLRPISGTFILRIKVCKCAGV